MTGWMEHYTAGGSPRTAASGAVRLFSLNLVSKGQESLNAFSSGLGGGIQYVD
jgi:hypothetical protein